MERLGRRGEHPWKMRVWITVIVGAACLVLAVF
jgi:hypothetical protein